MTKRLKKMLHICVIITIVVAIAFTALILILLYNENGESNMPFEISKITIISTTDAQDVEDDENIWNEKVSQNNDVYIDIVKNENYSDTAIIEKIILNNFTITKEPARGSLTIYRPSVSELNNFENIDEYETSEIVITGEQSTNIQNLQISNQGGRIAFRCANNSLDSYVSNEEDELNYSELLEKIGITDEDIQATVSLDIEIVLKGNKSFKTAVELDIPVAGVSETGKSSQEITDLSVVFKRVEN